MAHHDVISFLTLQDPSALETEHGLIMLLLLYSLLTICFSTLQRWTPVIVIMGILLALFTPSHPIDFFWPLLTGLIAPPLLWHAAVNVTQSNAPQNPWAVVVWLGTLILVILSLMLFSQQPFPTSLLLGILSVTLIWFFRELSVQRSFLSTIGQITLVVLLTEIDLMVISWRTLLGTFFSGTAIGLVVGFLSILMYRRFNGSSRPNTYFLLVAYASYLLGITFSTSAIAATLAAGVFVSVFGYSTGIWKTLQGIPRVSTLPFFFYLSTTAWLVLGWQAETTIVGKNLTGIPLVMVVIAAGIFIIRKISPISIDQRWFRLLRKEAAVFLLLVGGILLWPKDAFLTTLNVEIALLISLVLILLLKEILRPLFDLLGITLLWPSEIPNEQIDSQS